MLEVEGKTPPAMIQILMSRRESIIGLLSKVADDDLPPGEALAQWPNIDDPNDDKLMRQAWHSLYHYDTDEDIRAKEPDYEGGLKQGLRDILKQLKATG